MFEESQRRAELQRLRVEQELVEEGMRQEAQNRQRRQEIEFEALRRKVDNELSAGAIQMKLIEALPGIAEKMPKPTELKSFSIGGQDGLGQLVAGILRLVESVKEAKA